MRNHCTRRYKRDKKSKKERKKGKKEGRYRKKISREVQEKPLGRYRRKQGINRRRTIRKKKNEHTRT